MGIFSRIFRRRRKGETSSVLTDGTEVSTHVLDSSSVDSPDVSSYTDTSITHDPLSGSIHTTPSDPTAPVESTEDTSLGVDEFSLPDIDDTDDLEATGIATSYDINLTPEEITASRVFALMRKTADLTDRDRVVDQLMEIEVIGRLPGGWWAWVGPNDTWGVIDRDVRAGATGEPWRIQLGDRIRARIMWRPWYSVIENHDVVSLIRSDGERYFKRPSPVSPRKFESFLDDLETGDVVEAHVPYGPENPVDLRGNTGKVRPVVFVGWTNDGFALVRGAYTADPGRYINKLDATVLRKPHVVFNKPRVAVKRTSVVIYPTTIQRKFGRLHDDDLRLIGIEPRRIASGPRPQATQIPSIDPISTLSPEQRPYFRGLVDRLSKLASITAGDIATMLLDDIANNRFPSTRTGGNPVPATTLGQLVSLACTHFEVPRPRPFLAWLAGLLSSRPELGLSIYSSTTKSGVEVVHSTTPPGFVLFVSTPTSTPAIKIDSGDEAADKDSTKAQLAHFPAEPVVPIGNTHDEYSDVYQGLDDEWAEDGEWAEFSEVIESKIRVVIIDQLWTHHALGDRRVDLAQVKRDFVDEYPEVGTWMIAPDLPLIRGFLNRAQMCGWTLELLPNEDRTGLEDAIARVLSKYEVGTAVVISKYADFIAAVENLGWDCFVDEEFIQYAY